MKTLKKIKSIGFDLSNKSIYSIKGGMPGDNTAGDGSDYGSTGNSSDDKKG